MSTTPNLAEILANLGDGLSVFDKDRRVTFANDKASQIINSADEAFHNRITAALNGHTPRRFEYFHRTLNRWFEHQTYSNADGGMTVFSRDITSRHRMEDALRASEERFRRLIESNIIGVVVADSEFVTEANDVFLQMVGYSRDDLIRREIRWRDMTPPEYDELDAKARHELEATGVFSPYEKELIRKDGRRVAILAGGVVTQTEPIEAFGGVYMLRTEAHDVKIFEKALDLIERNAKTQVKIVNDLLDVSRIISGKLRLNMEPVDLSDVIQAALETVRPASETKGIEIQLRLEPFGAVVAGDADRLQQIVWNLLANAVKFTPNGGRIAVELMESGGYAEIRVTDNGIGIDADFLPYVFERFRQANTSRTRIHGGLGLGLAIVRHLVESHGGTVHAESSGDEQGATFIVRLPVRFAARAANP